MNSHSNIIRNTNLFITKFSPFIIFALLFSHIWSGASFTKILLVEGTLTILFLTIFLTSKKNVLINFSAFSLMTIAVLGLFTMVFLDNEEKVIINILFLFTPAFFSLLYQKLSIMIYTLILCCTAFLINVQFKPDLIFYEGYPSSYNIFIVLIYVIFGFIGAAQIISSNNLMKEIKRNEKDLKSKQAETLKLLNAEELSKKNISEFNALLSNKISDVTLISNHANTSSINFKKAFIKTSQDINENNQLIQEINKDTARIQTSSVNMSEAIISSNNSTQTANTTTTNLANIFKTITNNSNEHFTISTELMHSSKEIESIINTIEEISKRISILSLNASIEASKVGIHGAGFSAIASEIKNLAIKTSFSTSSISDILTTLKSQIELSSVLSENSQEVIILGEKELSSSVNSLNQILQANTIIKDDSLHLSLSIENVRSLVDLLAQNMQILQNTTSANEKDITFISDSITSLSNSLLSIVEQSKNL